MTADTALADTASTTGRPMPRQAAPALDVDLVGGGRFLLAEARPQTFTLVVVYRGLHCPLCQGYLADLQNRLADFRTKGVEVVAVSTDDRERAERTAAEWRLDRLALGYGLSIADARAWGLYISTGINDAEPAEFAEPGLFLVRPDGTLYAASIQTMPFARPQIDALAGAIDFVVARDYPARGEA
jgi:peroxiredoxin